MTRATRVINDECINCGVCVNPCPVDAISMGENHMEIDRNKCIDCAVCEIECPTNAISIG